MIHILVNDTDISNINVVFKGLHSYFFEINKTLPQKVSPISVAMDFKKIEYSLL